MKTHKLTEPKAKIQYRPRCVVTSEAGMSIKPKSHVFRTLNVRMRGKSGPFVSVRGFRDAAACLLDVAARPARVEILGRGEPTRMAHRRVGGSLRDALAQVRDRQV